MQDYEPLLYHIFHVQIVRSTPTWHGYGLGNASSNVSAVRLISALLASAGTDAFIVLLKAVMDLVSYEREVGASLGVVPWLQRTIDSRIMLKAACQAA